MYVETEWHCPECDYVGEPVASHSRYGSDRDGNRFIDMITVRCPKCDYEKAV